LQRFQATWIWFDDFMLDLITENVDLRG